MKFNSWLFTYFILYRYELAFAAWVLDAVPNRIMEYSTNLADRAEEPTTTRIQSGNLI
jgi:hypothetical protein